MTQEEPQIVYVLPCLDPDGQLIDLVSALEQQEDCAGLVIVDDGSSAANQYIFEQLALRPGCIVLHHASNQGKGAALKTAFHYLLSHYGEEGFSGCVTADSDCQHLPEDIQRVAAMLKQHRKALILGSRTPDRNPVPWKSRIGNAVTRFIFRFLPGLRLQDTQTGLRGLSPSFMKACLGIRGNRFEFETAMLLAAGKMRLPVVEVPIRKVYHGAAHTSHFHAVGDSLRIVRVLFRYYPLQCLWLTCALCGLIALAAVSISHFLP